MSKYKIYTLKNGLKLVLYQDKTKHRVLINLFINFGGIHKKIKYNNSTCKVKDGTAHFLEHLLIEHSIYGNSIIEFEKNYALFNGRTYNDFTEFYLDSVYNFEEDLVKLINVVNKSNFNKEDIEETKSAIIKEIMMSKDDKFLDLTKKNYECIFKNIKYPNILGNIKDIKNMNYEYTKNIYDIIYTPNNQILFVSGNFDIKKVKKLVEDTYKKIEFSKVNYKIIHKKEPKEIFKKEDIIKKDIYMDYVNLTYKVDISHLSNKEKVKLSFYLSYFLSYLFNSSSKKYNTLIEKNICDSIINYEYEVIDNFMLIKIGAYTNQHNTFIDEVIKTIEDKKFSRKYFELQKKTSIVNFVLREDNLVSIIEPFIDNVISYNYFNMDTISDIEEQSYLDYKKIINSLDFSEFCITKMIRESEGGI